MQIQGEEKYIDKQDIIVLQINHPQGLHPEVLVDSDTREHKHRRHKNKSRSPT